MKSNITKNFEAKSRSGLRFADGLQPTPVAPSATPVAPSATPVAPAASKPLTQPTAAQYGSDALPDLKARLGFMQQSNGSTPGPASGGSLSTTPSLTASAAQPTQPTGPTIQTSFGQTRLMNAQEQENAEKTARWRQDDLLSQAKYAPKGAQGAFVAALGNPTSAPMGLRASGMSGQDQENAENSARWRQDYLLSQAKYAPRRSQGAFNTALSHPTPGFAHGTVQTIQGPGTGSSDSVKGHIGGTPFNVSNGEGFMVVPKEAMDKGLGDEIGDMIQQATGKAPARGLRDQGGYYTGLATDAIDPKELRPEFRAQAQTPVIQQAANPGLEASRNVRAANAINASAQPQGFYEKMGRQMVAETGAPKTAQVMRAVPKTGISAGLAGAAEFLGPITTGVMGGLAAANFVDSFPSLRGRATAEASNMELAGTPQHEAEVNKALVAQDSAWEQRHGKTLSDAQRTNAPTQAAATKPKLRFEDLPQADYSHEGRAKPQATVNPISTVDRTLVDNTLGKDAAIPQGLRNRWAGNDPMKAQQYISADNAANGLRNNPSDGHGVVSIKQADGTFKNVLMAPSQYTGADGKPTSDWSKTAQFAQGTAQAAKDKASLRNLEYSNAKFNATSDQITDPNARAAGLRGLAQYDVEEKDATAKAIAAAKAQNDNIQLQLTKRGQDITMRGQDNMQENSARDAAAAAEKVKQADANSAAELYFTTNDEKTGDKIVNYGALGRFNRWKSSFTQNDPRAKLEQAELFRRFMAEQSVKERGAGGAKTELPINHTGQREARLSDVFTRGNGVLLPTGKVETFDNGAAVRSSAIPKDEYDTRRLLGLDK